MNEKERMQDLNKSLEELIKKRDQDISGFDYSEIIATIKANEAADRTVYLALLEKACQDTSTSSNIIISLLLSFYRINKLQYDLTTARAKITSLEDLLKNKSDENENLKADLAEQKILEEQLKKQLDNKVKAWKEVTVELNKSLVKYKTYDQDKKTREKYLLQIQVDNRKKLAKQEKDLTERHENEMDRLRLEYDTEKLRLKTRIKDLEKLMADARRRETLTSEINRYEELLDLGCQTRINQEDGLDEDPDEDETPRAKRSGPVQTPGGRNKRSRRTLQFPTAEYASTSSNASTSTRAVSTSDTSSNTGLVEIDVDPNGQFIQLQNKTNRTRSLRGWQLNHKIDDEDHIIFTFPSPYALKKHDTVTIWSSDAGRSPSPPSHLVLDPDINWGSGNNTETTLVNGSEQVMAWAKRQFENEVASDDNYAEPDSQESFEEGTESQSGFNSDDEDEEVQSRCKTM
ncbi:uncharacterized protein [Amphiura filiformis]|uniref:uncharacterized protein n=1 Tax=Amphiura filiformis TaxID=82378 RepID=UPI003B21B11C